MVKASSDTPFGEWCECAGLWEDLRALIVESRPEVVSFDFFDTLMLRAVPRPIDVFLKVQEALSNQGLAEGLSATEFRTMRVAAEREARLGNQEIDLRKIWAELSKRTGIDLELGLKSELQVERDLLFPYWPAMDLLEWVALNGMRVCIVSDTYLASDFLRSLLPRSIQPLVHHLYASNEWAAGKGSGLWPLVIEELRVMASEIFHMGDDYRSDVEIPSQHGIHARLVWNGTSEFWQTYIEEIAMDPRGADLAATEDAGLTSLRARATHLRRAEDRTLHFDLGAQVLGPVASAFGSWVARQTAELRLEALLCARREGTFLGKFVQGSGASPLVDLSVSRKTALLASLSEVTHASLSQLSERLGLLSNPTSFRQLLGLRPSAIPDTVRSSEELVELVVDDRVLAQHVLERAREVRVGLIGHLRDEFLEQGIVEWPSQVGLVDVGWGGSIQLGLVEALQAAGVPMRITGLYIMTGPAIERVQSLASSARGMLADGGEPSGFFRAVIRSVEVLEQAFSVPGGSAIEYGPKRPNLSDDLVPQWQREAIAEIQDGVKAFHLTWLRSRSDLPPNWIENLPALRAVLWRFIAKPSGAEVQLFEDWVHDDNLGSGLTDPLYLPEIRALGRYMTTRQLVNLGGHKSYWPSAAAIKYGPYRREEWLAIDRVIADVGLDAFERRVESGDSYLYVDAGDGFREPWAAARLATNALGLSCIHFTKVPVSDCVAIRLDPCDQEGLLTLGPTVLRYDREDGSVVEEVMIEAGEIFELRGVCARNGSQLVGTNDVQLLLARERMPGDAVTLDITLGLSMVPVSHSLLASSWAAQKEREQPTPQLSGNGTPSQRSIFGRSRRAPGQ